MIVAGGCRAGASWRTIPGRGFARGNYVKPLIVALLTLVASAGSQENEGDWCLTDDGYEGICRHLRSCPYLQSKKEVYNGAGAGNPHLCSFGTSGTIVCCPTITPPPVPFSGPIPGPHTTPATTKAPVRRPPTTKRPTPRPTPPREVIDSVVVVPSGGNSRISDIKCQEYMNLLVDEVTALRVGEGLTDVWCPYPPPGNELIVGGTTANSGEYPHVAALGYLVLGQLQWLCGGSLISHNYVLTAAHCVSSQVGTVVAVNLGALRVANMSFITAKLMMSGAGKTSNMYPVAESIRHHNFRKFSHYHDIALVRLAVPVPKFDLQVRPACLQSDSRITGIQKAVACGFGHTKYQDPSTSRVLKHVTLDLYSSDVCTQVFSAVLKTSKLSEGIRDSQLCAGHLAGGKDTCDGDSGGPLQMRDKKDKCIIRILGVTSFGTVLCGSENTAALYTKVAHYLPWIESVVWPSS
ncbi:mite allergen Der f 3-like [Hetaerina americana]|uniref:mite allergen Der f 3-like n=1 Tax=Hetaerina americana TaxID=62018 RepID=UPI003A7F5B6E